jgi:MFS family permease
MKPPRQDGQTGRNVFWLGMVSLFTDLSSQMIYPLMPEFLSVLGASKSVIGIIEGLAEGAASLLRTVFGRWSDRLGRRKVFVYLGYGISALSKPVLCVATLWPHVLGVRLADRLGKAMRTPSRDALISTSVGPDARGRAFGFHRAMDRIGAIGGPLLALLVLRFFTDRDHGLRMVFLLSAVPALLALVFIRFTRESAVTPKRQDRSSAPQGLRNPAFVVFLVAAVVFTLGNASNAFLILKAREVGLSVALIPAYWITYNAACTVSSPVFGHLSDKVGRTPVLAASFLYSSFLYLFFGLSDRLETTWILIAAYGVYYGLSEGVIRAYIADLVEPGERATAYGIFNTAVGLALVAASILFGAVWDGFGSRAAFLLSSALGFLGFTIFSVGTLWRRSRATAPDRG